MPILRPIVFALVLLLSPLAARAGDQDADRWYELWINGSRSGWAHEVVTTQDGRITTRSESEMTIGRADQAVTISSTTEFVETTGGEAIELTVIQQFGQSPIEAKYTFREDGILLTKPGEQTPGETVLPLPQGEWLPQAAAARFVAQRLESGATEITLRTLDPSNGLTVATIARREITPAEVEVLGTPTSCFHAKSTTRMAATTIEAEEWLAPDGALLRSEMAIGAMTITQVASTRAAALRRAEPAELMVSTFVKPSRAISNARARVRGVFEVRIAAGELPELPSSAYQSAEVLDGRSARVTIDTRTPVAAGEVDRGAFLASTTFADADDELIGELTGEAAAEAEGDAAKAEALRRFVFAHIGDKNLGTAFATASETARTGKGDCTEHGVLLAAMLRAAGIPSRVAVGVVYVDRFAGERNVFGYHMWTQALLETDAGPAWIDLDATLDEHRAFDATHIAFAVSGLGEGDTISSLSGIAPLLGALQIDVQETK